MGSAVYERVQRCVAAIREKTDFVPKAALVLGSGLGDFADAFTPTAVVEYGEIPGFPVSTVTGHKGRFIFADVCGTPTVMMQGRVHYYEGYPMQDVVLPTRVMGALGAKDLILTNAAGGINSNFDVGDLMMITGQISLFVPSPLIGPNVEELGPRFPDMSKIYNPDLCAVLRDAAAADQITLREGVYAQLTGPQYESPQEIRALRLLGADAVGMSTAVEAIAANHMGMRVCGVSCISNKAAGLAEQPLSHAEVQAAADACAVRFSALIRNVLARLSR